MPAGPLVLSDLAAVLRGSSRAPARERLRTADNRRVSDAALCPAARRVASEAGVRETRGLLAVGVHLAFFPRLCVLEGPRLLAVRA